MLLYLQLLNVKKLIPIQIQLNKNSILYKFV
jgi:hypothetical protein